MPLKKSGRSGLEIGRKLRINLQTAGERVLELCRHPEAESHHIMQVVMIYRRLAEGVNNARRESTEKRHLPGNYEFAQGVLAGLDGKAHWAY